MTCSSSTNISSSTWVMATMQLPVSSPFPALVSTASPSPSTVTLELPGNTLAACASLQVNDVVLAGPKDKNMQDQEDSATVVLAVHLNAGDQVSVKLPIGCFLCGDNSHYNTFTGFLLYATD
ncbi:Complement C1q-like protein 2 [Larimichthys crocea]|uniref:Uncharacterized protein n=1 Tax=Larimichthys crocea TaxID=215358 RepID=A0ACD3QJ43_LARCR|nr:Complement C1q-like protein 2 [Larimichthys crocea]